MKMKVLSYLIVFVILMGAMSGSVSASSTGDNVKFRGEVTRTGGIIGYSGYVWVEEGVSGSLPDLIINFIRWSPSSPDKGDTIDFAVKIKNQGSGSAGSFTVKFYIDGSYVGSHSMGDFPAGSTGGVIFKWTANKCGDVKVKAVADANNEVAETTERNNDRTETVSIKCPTLKPDLIIKDILWSPSSPDKGDTIEFAVRIMNQGSGSAGSFRVNIYIDGSYVGYVSASKLPAGSIGVATFTWTASKCGDVKVKAVADANNEVAETTEKNNDRTETVSIKCPTLKPDLIIKDILWSPSSPDKGDTIEFAVRIMNQGSGSAGSSTVKYYIDGSYVGYASISNFPAGSIGVATFTWTASKCGDVKVKAVADANNEVAETTEKNNDRTETVSIKCPTLKPDLIIPDISWSPSNPYAGDIIAFTVTIKNQGSGSAGSSTAKYYVDGSYVGYDSVPALSAGSTTTQTFTWTANKCGTVQVKAVADANSDVQESDETNNEKQKSSEIYGPDLIVQEISWPSEPVCLDKPVTITVKVKNQGNRAVGVSTVKYYVDNLPIDSDTILSLYSGYTSTQTFSWTPTICGDHNIKAVADANNNVQECDETNNEKQKSVHVVSPDLVIQSLTWAPTTPKKGDSITFTVTIKNQGDADADSSQVRLFIRNIEVDPISASVGPIAAGSTVSKTFTWSADSCAKTAVSVIADADNEVDESREDNNYLPKTIYVKCPDLEITNISWSPSNPYAGDIIAFTVTIKNQGSGSAGSSTAKYYVDGSYVGYDSVPALSAGSTTTQTFTWTANKCGTVQVKAVADANSDVQESDETNNEKQKSSEIYGPDLIVQEISWPSEPVCLDKPVTITVKVKNQGNRAAGASTVKYYIDNLPIDSDTILSLYSGYTSTQTFSWTPTICGDHNIKAVADANNNVQECDETNNEKQKSVHVISPDLIIQSLTWAPKSPKKGDSVTFTVTIENQGDADADSSHVRLFIRNIEVDPVSVSVGPIAAGSTVSKTFTWTADSCAKTAVSVIADADNEVDESREDNNYLPKTIYVKCPDLEITNINISWSPKGDDLHAGDDLNISYTIMNNGEVDAEDFKTSILIDSLPFRTFFTPSLSANTETIGVCTWKAVRGTHSIKVETDAQKKVEESDETNNEDRADIVVDEEPVDLIITGIEVTQAIQNLEGDVPLIEAKDTFVRVYMKTNSRSIPNVKGTLKGFRNSKSIGEITNRNKWNYIAKDSGKERPSIDEDSGKERPSIDERRSDDFYLLLFKLPDEWLSGDITIKVEIEPDPRYTLEEICSCTPCERKLQFNKAGRFTIAFVPIHHKPSNTKPDFGDFEKVYQEFVKLYPISKDDVSIELWPALEIDYNPTNNESEKCPTAWGNCGLRLLGDLQFLASYQTRKNSDQNLIIYGLVDSEVKCKADNHGPLWGYGEMGDGKTFGTRCAWGIDGTFGGSYMAHGIGHNLGRKHIDCGGPKNIDMKWPYGEDKCHLAPETPAGFWGFDVNERSVRAPSEYSDFMTYSAPYWVSNYTYTALFESIKEREIVSSLSKGSPVVMLQPEEIDMIIIHGFINISADEATFNNFFHRNGTHQDSSSICQQRFEIQLQDLVNNVLVNHSFSISNADGSDIYDFVELVRYNSKTAYIVLKHNNKTLANVTVSDFAPNVTVEYPNEDIILEVNVKIRWAACDNDSDDEELQYTVDYSPDNGSNWLSPIALALDEKKYLWNTSDLQGSKEGLIRVTASDGVNTGRDISDAVFTVLEKGPKVNITHPTNGTLITEGNYIKLIGSGHDLEDGMLNDSALTWNSSLNGDLGNGKDIETRNLTRGVHTITLMGEDSNGNMAYDNITISVLDSATIDTPKGTARLSATDGVIIGACRVNESLLHPLPEVEFPFGVFNFNISNISSGQTVNVSIELPRDLPSDAEYWMYGRTTENSSPHWYDDIQMEICEDNRTVTIQLIEIGDKGDDDMYENGTIVVTGAPGVPVIPIFDTKTPANPYPSVSGTHTGTITPIRDVNISKLYTYPCSGTCGHTETIELYENNTLIANGTWTGYKGDWHNITIAHNITGGVPYVTLLKTHKYNYTILTGSYPQIHHNSTLLTDNGWINCTNFTDSNGKRYYDWIPAIRLW